MTGQCNSCFAPSFEECNLYSDYPDLSAKMQNDDDWRNLNLASSFLALVMRILQKSKSTTSYFTASQRRMVSLEVDEYVEAVVRIDYFPFSIHAMQILYNMMKCNTTLQTSLLPDQLHVHILFMLNLMKKSSSQNGRKCFISSKKLKSN